MTISTVRAFIFSKKQSENEMKSSFTALAVYLLAIACTSNVQAVSHTIIFPKAFRIGAQESIILNLHGYTGQATISAFMLDLPDRNNIFSSIDPFNVAGNDLNNPIVLPMQVQSNDILSFSLRQKVQVVVRVQNSDDDFDEETNILVSKESGYLFVKTNRPVYRPGENVLIQVAPLDQLMAPADENIVTITVQTPDGVGVYRRTQALTPNNFIEMQFKIPDLPQLGDWSIKATYANNGFNTTKIIEFRVDRYVLPTFNVEIILEDPFLLPSSIRIFPTIRATFSYGEIVEGSYFIRMLVKLSELSAGIQFFQDPGGDLFNTQRLVDGQKRVLVAFERNLNPVLEESGATIESLIENKGSIIIEVVVNSQASGVLETARREVPFLASPFEIDTSRSSLYYTPGLAYQLRADLLSSVSRQPLSDVPVQIEVIDGTDSEIFNVRSNQQGEINRQIDFTPGGNKNILIRTNSEEYVEASQRNTSLEILPYVSLISRYIQIRGTSNVVSVGATDYFLTFSFNSPTPAEIRYIVLARGTAVLAGVNVPNPNTVESSQQLIITQDMVPNARVVAYYVVGNSEIVANSYWFDVINQCQTELSVTIPEQVLPGQSVTVDITGENNALVSLSAVDRAAYFIFNKTRITRKEMFTEMGDYDQGCVRNGGEDSPNVFLNAGLILSSDNIPAPEINNLECANGGGSNGFEVKRKKRQAGNNFGDLSLGICERDGKLPDLSGRTCEERSLIVEREAEIFLPGCLDVFFFGCQLALSQRIRAELRPNPDGRTASDQAAEEVALGTPRTDFRESLFFRTQRLDNNGDGSFTVEASDSITTYELDSFSMADTANGFCVSDTENMRIFKDVFAQLTLPFSLKIREQAIIRFSLFNYSPRTDYNNIEVRVQTSQDLCSNYQGDLDSQSSILSSSVTLFAQSSDTFDFAVLPLRIPANDEKAQIIVQVIHNGQVLDDLRKEILIEEAGILQDIYQSYDLDVTEQNPQNFIMELRFPENFVPGTRKCSIFGYTNFLGPVLEVNDDTGEARDVEKFFRNPFGCGEQNMIVCGPNIYTHMYLEAVGRLTPESGRQYNASIERIEDCYTRELKWRSTRTDPPLQAFAVWDRSPPNLWLNAFVVKVFARGRDYFTDLDVGPLCSALNWIIGEQDPAGFFHERYGTHHREMKGPVQGRMTLAAYTLISLEESRHICPDLLSAIDQSTTAVSNYLIANKDSSTFIGRPYSLALLSYALALEDSASTFEINNRLLALRRTSADGRQVHWTVRDAGSIAGTDLNPYWFQRKPEAIDVEATAYALLAQIQIARINGVTQEALDLTRQIARWLVSQRNDVGAFISTQDTVIGLQALATYEIWIAEELPPALPTDITVTLYGQDMAEWNQTNPQIIHLDESNENFRSIVEVPDNVINGINVSAFITGHGEGVLSYRCTYKTLVDEGGCHFELDSTVTVIPPPDDEALAKVQLRIEVSKPQGPEAYTPVVEIGLLSGYRPEEQSVAAITLANRVDGVAERYDITEQSVVLYFREINQDVITFAITMFPTLDDILPQPAAIRVFDYYEPSISCTHFYSLPSTLPFLRTSNCESEDDALCSCAEGGCPVCRSRSEQLDQTVCLVSDDCQSCKTDSCLNMYQETCNRNYAYVVRVLEITHSADPADIFTKFTAEVTEILKFGNDASVEKDSIETFLVRHDCFENCVDPGFRGDYINEGNELFIAGSKIDASLNREGEVIHVYELNENAILERKIPDDTCVARQDTYTKNNCGQPNQRTTDARCSRWKGFIDSCNNFSLMRDRLAEGCD